MTEGHDASLLEKAELLLLDTNDSARQFLVKQFEHAGMIVTATDDVSRALQLAREKYFAVILLDLDTPTKNTGVEQIALFSSASSASAVMLICAEGLFESVAQAFRNGASDVGLKDQPDYLIRRVTELCGESRRRASRDELLQETLELHDLFLRQLMETYRRAEAAEEEASGQSVVMGPGVVLVVDDNPRTASGLQQALGEQFTCVSALNGGEALDYATNRTFDLALVKQSLPDLSGTMVSRTLRSQSGDGIVVMFEHPGPTPGYASIVEADRNIDLIPELTAASQLVDRLKGLHKAYAVKKREKRYIQSFRQTHGDFLKQFVTVRQRIQQLLPDRRAGGASR